jgi:two-component system NtrC family sensor kinase
MIQPFAKLRVLLVEDDRAMALPLKMFIENAGHEVVHVTTGEAAVACYGESPPDMVLMDLIMPGIGGVRATRQIKAVNVGRWVPLIIMTSLASDADIIKGLEAGADEYLTKPLNFDVLGARMRAMQRIAGMQKALSEVLANVTDGIVLINAQGRIQSFNHAARKIFGYQPNEVLGQNVSLLMPAPHRAQHDGYLQRFMTTREPRVMGQSRRLEGVRKNGTVFPMRLGVSSVMSPDGEIFIGLIHDLSEEVANHEMQTELSRKLAAAREQALQSERTASLGYLSAGIAHEMNSPLGYVQSNLGSLRACAGDLLRLAEQISALGPTLPPEVAAEVARLCKGVDLDYLRCDLPRLADEMQTGLKQIQHVVSSLRDVMRPGEPDYQRVDLAQSVASALALLHGRFAPGLTIERDFGDEPAWVECSPAELGQVLLSLLQNAVQATGEGGTISLRLCGDPEYVTLTIADSGAGIAPEILPHIFDPFFTTRPVGEGKGLGLYIAAGIARRHGGQITVDSPPGQGSRFTLWLPRIRASGDPA